MGLGESEYSATADLTGDDSFMNTGDAHNLSIGNPNTDRRLDVNGYIDVTWDHQLTYPAYGAFGLWFRIKSDSPIDSQWKELYAYDTQLTYDPNQGSESTTTRSLDGLFLTWPGNIDLTIVSGGDGIPSNVQTVQLQGTLNAPTNVTATRQQDGTYVVEWTPSLDSSNASGQYWIYTTVPGDPINSPHFAAIAYGSTTSSAVVSVDGPDASFFVIAVDNEGLPGYPYYQGHNSVASNVFDAITPDVPSNFEAHALGSSAIGLTWARTNNATGYIIKRSTTNSTEPSTWPPLTSINSGSTTSFLDTTADDGTTYYYAMEGYHTGSLLTEDSNFTGVETVTLASTTKVGGLCGEIDKTGGKTTGTMNLLETNENNRPVLGAYF